MTNQATASTGLKPETIEIVAGGATMLGTLPFTTNPPEDGMDRAVAEFRSEAQADRALFTQEILRLTAEQSRLAGVVEGAGAE